MENNGLIDWIENSLNSGFDFNYIQNILKNQGYSSEEISQAINYVKNKNNQNKKENNPFIHKDNSNTKKVIITISSILIILIIASIIFIFMNYSEEKISEEEFSQGKNISIKENQKIKFPYNEKEYTIITDSKEKRLIKITSKEFNYSIEKNFKNEEGEKFDLDDDGFYDIKIKLTNTDEENSEIYIKKIYEKTCSPEWECSEWSSCDEGTKTRDCLDINDCNIEENKPDERRNCEPVESCETNWTCTKWSECLDNKQKRTCTDENDCGTEENKPEETRECETETIENNTKDEEPEKTESIEYIITSLELDKDEFTRFEPITGNFNFFVNKTTIKVYFFSHLEGPTNSQNPIIYANLSQFSVTHNDVLPEMLKERNVDIPLPLKIFNEYTGTKCIDNEGNFELSLGAYDCSKHDCPEGMTFKEIEKMIWESIQKKEVNYTDKVEFNVSGGPSYNSIKEDCENNETCVKNQLTEYGCLPSEFNWPIEL